MSGKPLTWDEINRRAIEFVHEWRGATSEQSDKQLFWADLLQVFGVNVRRMATFEKAAKRTSTGKHGWIDLLWPGVVAVEHKSSGKNLEDAESQNFDYFASLNDNELPQLSVACDFANFRVLDLDTREVTTFTLDELPKNIHVLGPLAGYRRRDYSGQEQASVKAAQLLASVYTKLEASGYEGHDLALLSVRLLFVLFADDTEVWRRGLLQELIEDRTTVDGADLGPFLMQVFQVLNTPLEKRQSNLDEDLASFPYINGGLFRDPIHIPTFDKASRDALVAASQFDWSAVSPAIFGSIFQDVKDPKSRREMGQHYTTEANIYRLIRPLFLDDLHERFNKAKNSEKDLRRLHDYIAELTFFDPAAGSGNFLIVTYQALRQLELSILKRLRELATSGGRSPLEGGALRRTGRVTAGQLGFDVAIESKIHLGQFYAIELDDFSAEIAEVAMYLIDHLENMRLSAEFGMYFARFPISESATIVKGNATRIDWNSVIPATECDYVLGNPPFVGMSLMDKEQQTDRDIAMALLPNAERTGRLDYVCCWYAKAIDYARYSHTKVAFVSTNSITQGEQARSMGPMLADNRFHIDFAHRTFGWTSEASGKAAVHVVIVGFSGGAAPAKRRLFDYPTLTSEPVLRLVENLNFYLIDSAMMSVGKHTVPFISLPKLTEGNRPQDGGGLIIDADEVQPILDAEPNLEPYIRPLIGAHDMLNGEPRYCFWLVAAPPNVLRASQELKRRLDIVADARSRSKTEKARDKAASPSLFFAIRQPAHHWLCIPRHSSANRAIVPMAFFEPEEVAHDSVLAIDGAPLWTFSILQSRVWMSWARAISGRLKSDIRISPDMAYNAFPWPEMTDQLKASLDAAGDAVLDARAEFPDQTLADLYHPLATPKALLDAHRALDTLVFKAYGIKPTATDAEILEALFRRYTEWCSEPTLDL